MTGGLRCAGNHPAFDAINKRPRVLELSPRPERVAVARVNENRQTRLSFHRPCGDVIAVDLSAEQALKIRDGLTEIVAEAEL